jgi:hypothetical protein
MTDNATTKGGVDAESESALTDFDSTDEQADALDDLTEIDDLDDELTETDGPDDELTETDDDNSGEEGALGIGALTGAFGFAGIAFAIVSLTTNWTSSVMVSHSDYTAEIAAPSSGMPLQQQLNMYVNGWHTQGWWALIFAGAAVLCGAGALLLPTILRRRDAPGWANAAATCAIIVGLIGVLLAVLTIVGVFGGHLTAPPTPSS